MGRELGRIAAAAGGPVGRGHSLRRAAAQFQRQTIREILRLSTGGQTLRIRFTNEYGAAPVTIGAVHVGLANGKGGIVPGSDRVVTFNGGSGSVTIPTAAPALSDPVTFPVPGLTSLAISLYVPSGGNPGYATSHTSSW